MKKGFWLSSLSIIMSVLILTGCGSEKERGLEEKIDSEIDYMESIIFTVANKQAKSEYTEEDKFNWDLVKNDLQKINNSYSTLVLDATEVNVPNEKLMQCSNNINKLLLTISEKNEILLLENLYNLYNSIIDIKDEYTEDKNMVKNMRIKSYTLNIYYLSYGMNYIESEAKVKELEDYYNGLMNDSNYVGENNYHLNKLYILIQEYKMSIQSKNIDLIKIKYLNLVEKV